MASASSAFDLEAAVYDETFGRNPAGLLFRYVFQERLRAVFPPGARIIDLGSGTGIDALFLAGQGRFVHGLDPSASMVERARAKAATMGLTESQVRFEPRAAEDVGGIGTDFDGAYSDFGALNCADLRAVGEGLPRVLRPGARVVLSLMGPSPLPHAVHRGLTGRGERRGAAVPRVAGVPVKTTYPSRDEAERQLGPDFDWHRGFGLGVVVPDPAYASWIVRHPQTFGFLAAVESVVRSWPVLRSLGDYVVLEGVRR